MSDKSTSGARSDGWCGSCGEIFMNRLDSENTCANCGLSLAIPEGGPPQVVENFKNEFVGKGVVIDAWFDEASKFLIYQVTTEIVPLANCAIIDSVYQGLPTVLTLFPRETH